MVQWFQVVIDPLDVSNLCGGSCGDESRTLSAFTASDDDQDELIAQKLTVAGKSSFSSRTQFPFL